MLKQSKSVLNSAAEPEDLTKNGKPQGVRSIRKSAMLFRRLMAFFVDCLIIASYAFLLFLVASAVELAWSYQHYLSDSLLLRYGVSFFSLTLPVILYFTLLESSVRGATLGKQLFKLRVVSTKGPGIATGNLLIRTLVKLAPWELSHLFLQLDPNFLQTGEPELIITLPGLIAINVLALVYLAIPAIRKDNAAIHDLASKTEIVFITIKHQSS